MFARGFGRCRKIVRDVEDAVPYGLHENKHRPTQNGGSVFLAPEGSIGEGRKSVKKSAALLRFLAFLALDHPFGVLRGE